ncbi:hypothetical protein F4678DRAFT_412907 [Xylaria arbuscula]|nr:hypothetical protein F4678DRAFT_412907 [Xylaria arbuscula]
MQKHLPVCCYVFWFAVCSQCPPRNPSDSIHGSRYVAAFFFPASLIIPHWALPIHGAGSASTEASPFCECRQWFWLDQSNVRMSDRCLPLAQRIQLAAETTRSSRLCLCYLVSMFDS